MTIGKKKEPILHGIVETAQCDGMTIGSFTEVLILVLGKPEKTC